MKLKKWARLMARIYHHYLKCEEFKSGMWKTIPANERQAMIDQSVLLMKDHEAFKNAMFRVIEEWPYSCEANLSASSINHRSWIGQAACAIHHDCPEDLTRLAWRSLTEENQAIANQSADDAKRHWEKMRNA